MWNNGITPKKANPGAIPRAHMGTSNKNQWFEREENKGSLSPAAEEADPLTAQLNKRPNLGEVGRHWPSPWLNVVAHPQPARWRGGGTSGITVWHFIHASSMSGRDLWRKEGQAVWAKKPKSSVTGYINRQKKKPPMKKSPSKHAFALNKFFMKPV